MRATTNPTAEVEAGPWSRKAFWAVIAVAFLVRAVWMLNVNTMPVTDFDWYFQRAVEIAGGDGYSVDGEPTAYWPVGYSGFLSVFFFVIKPTVTFAKLLNLLLVLVSVALAFRLAHYLFRSNAVAVVSSLLLAFHFNWIAYSGILASEPLYTTLTLWGTWVLLTSKNERGPWTWGGLLFGLATLVRPQAALMPAIVLWCASRYDGDRSLPTNLPKALWTAYTMLVLVLVPWTARNINVFKSPVVVSTNMGDNLLIGNHPAATGGYMDPTKCGVNVSGLGEVERNSKTTKAALDHITEHPWRTVQLWPAKVWNTFGRASDGPYWAFMKTKGQLTTPGVGDDKRLFLASRSYAAWYHGALMVLFAVSVPVLIAARRRLVAHMRVPVLGIALIAYAILISVVFFGNPRFAFPVMPYVAMYAGALLVMVWTSLAPVKDKGPEDGPQDLA
jgi:4-amino-4-deoxy-L-arabinose transferase-like glycosyltransferase